MVGTRYSTYSAPGTFGQVIYPPPFVPYLETMSGAKCGGEFTDAGMRTKDMATRKPDWAVRQIVRRDRPDRCVEDICRHGIGHPNKQWLMKQNDTYAGVHGCDGCCHES